MHEGRPATVRLLDGEFLEISVIARLSVNDVLTLAAHHCRITQPDTRFFGLAYVDSNDHYHWLQPGKNLLDYEFPSDKAVIQLTHNVRFFVDSILCLENPSTIEMFFLEAHQQLRKGQLDLSNIDYARVGGLLLQIYRGDIIDDNSLINHLRSLLPFPPRLTRQYGVSQSSFEKQVLAEYSKLRGLQRGSAIVSVMQIVEKCLKYGSRLYRVKERDGSACILSINNRGIQVFENEDTFRPKENFHWCYLDNLYYKENIFSVEVRDPRSKQITDFNVLGVSLADDDDLALAVSDPTTQVSISRRCQSIPAGICVHTFVCESGALCRTIWTTAISQHQFFLDQKEREKSGRTQGSAVDHRELGEKLNRLVSRSSIGSSLPSLSSLHSSSSLNTMPSAKVADGSYSQHRQGLKNGLKQKTGEDRQRDIELYKILRGKKAELEELLKARINELRSVCLKEGELTGEMPQEISATLRPGEEMPKLKKRVGTSFSIPEEILKSDKADKLSQLETDVELHKRIVAAAERLAKDKTMNKSVRKKRQKDLAAAAMKLRGLELGLNQMRLSASKPDVSSVESNGSGGSWSAFPQQNNGTTLTRAVAKSCPTTPRGSVPDLCTDGEKSDYEDDEQVQQRQTSSASRRSLHQRFSEASTSSNGSIGLPPRANSRRSNATRSITSDELDNPLINAQPSIEQTPVYENIGYRSTSYRSSYRQAHYPTLQDEQHLRKRALSAHSISQTDVPNSACYNIRLENASFQFKQEAKTNIPEDDDITPTIEHPEPLRRIPTSFSCQAGFSTASLDRRIIVQRSSPQAANGGITPSRRESQPYSLSPSRGHSPAAHRITTFPVCNPVNGNFDRKPYSSSDLPRFQPVVNRPPHAPYVTRGQQMGRNVPGSASVGKLPAHPDAHMEALLDYYKNQSNQSSAPKTATIV
ncbi:hypothetical protein V3C99_006833 [Haemonchus contortus]